MQICVGFEQGSHEGYILLVRYQKIIGKRLADSITSLAIRIRHTEACEG